MLNQPFQGEPKNRDCLLELISASEQNELIDHDTSDILEGVMDTAEQQVRNIMIPCSQIITLMKNQSLQECLDVIVESAHSRFPVISEDKGNVEGILLAKDLLSFMFSHDEPFGIEKILRLAVVVQKSKRVYRMLKEFRSQRYHMTIIIDAFGDVSGLVTINDILELIVREIENEYDDEEDRDIRQLNRHTCTIRALTPLRILMTYSIRTSAKRKWIPSAAFSDTAFGYLSAHGKVINIDGYNLKMAIANSRHIIQLHVKILNNSPQPTMED